jgi:hypothetical protein
VKLSKQRQNECGIPPLSEAEFTRQVLALAKVHGWRTAHFRPAWARSGKMITAVQGDGKGFPDLVLVKGGRLIFAELKAAEGRLKPEQVEWLNDLSKVPEVGVYLWRPADWPGIARVLSGQDDA